MFSLERVLDLPLVWHGLIGTAIFLYVVLDGFDLGVGILFPFAPSETCRNRMMNSVAPFWDGNETWLVLGGGGLLAAFPLAYSVLMPALYLPVILMLLGLIFRGVAFEFRFKAEGRSRALWDRAFHVGSLTAAFMQGAILGAAVKGIRVEGRAFAGGPLDWLNAYSVMVGIALVCGYALLGATWVVMKTDGITRDWARKAARSAVCGVGLFLLAVTVWMPILSERARILWFSLPSALFLAPLPLGAGLLLLLVWRDLRSGREVRPFLASLGVFASAYLGLGITLWPWLVPYEITFRQAAASPESQSALLVGTVFLLPLILGYMAYVHWVFRGKTSEEPAY